MCIRAMLGKRVPYINHPVRLSVRPQIQSVFPQICYQMVTRVWISPLCLNFTYVSLITRGKPY